MAARTSWVIDRPHTTISFSVRYLMMTNITGYFNDYTARITTVGEDFMTAEIEFKVDTKSIDTHDNTRDVHLKSSDFFDSERFNEIVFKSKAVQKCSADDKYILKGDLTIKGITNSIELKVDREGAVIDMGGKLKTGFHISGVIRRSDWKMNWNTLLQMGGVMIGDSVQIVCEIQIEPEKINILGSQDAGGVS